MSPVEQVRECSTSKLYVRAPAVGWRCVVGVAAGAAGASAADGPNAAKARGERQRGGHGAAEGTQLRPYNGGRARLQHSHMHRNSSGTLASMQSNAAVIGSHGLPTAVAVCADSMSWVGT